jgi:periplasmic divalent cation tolerance protein
MLIFYITYPDTATANQIGNTLIDQKLIACYNLIPIQSAYLWEGTLCADNEVATLLKTSKHLEQAVELAILAIHPYTTPCIIRWEVQANEAYENWVTASVQP